MSPKTMMLKSQRSDAPKVDTGLSESARKDIADGLGRVLADTYTTYLKSHGYHWNVTGPWFATLHQMFEEQYQEAWAAVDDIAERMRALGAAAPATYASFNKLTSVDEDEPGYVPAAEEMIRNLVAAHNTCIKTIRSTVPKAQKAGDEASLDILVGRLRTHEKTAWMLRSLLG